MISAILCSAALAAISVPPASPAPKPVPEELTAARQFLVSKLTANDSAGLPFSFKYDGRPSSGFLKRWKRTESARKLDIHRARVTVTYTDPASGLVLRCVAVAYNDYPTVEWTCYLKNTGKADTAIISDVLPVDTGFSRAAAAEFVLHHFTGTPCTPLDYQPFVTTLGPKAARKIGAAGGRPCSSDMPYFNLEYDGGGAILAVGWPGQWSAEFARDDKTGLRIKAGQELTHFKLHPGEEVRTPLVALQFYKGDWVRAQNVWRRWMVAHNLPRPGGKLPPVQMAACSSHQFGEMINANTENQKMFVDRYLQEKLPLDYWWMDAGWYPNEGGWPNTGTWEVDQKRFPGGFRPITDHAHAKGVKIIVWFEPERVTGGTWLYTKHPEWLLTNPQDPNGQKLLNLGNPQARRWLTDHVDKTLTEQGIDLYRQDFNIDPLVFWRGADAEDRQGIAEIRHVEGYLAYWDELRRRHPKMLIDSCASGGRRNDLETLRRSVPLLRSDFLMEPTSQQGHTYGIAFWYPYYGTGGSAIDTYQFRSLMCPAFNACFDMRKTDADYALARKIVGEWKLQIAPNMLGDYYPLTGYSLEKNVWMAFQFDRPEAGQGVVLAFRREESGEESQVYKLRGLDAKASYTVKNLDTGSNSAYAGKELMEKGLTVALASKPGSAVLVYSKAK